MGADYLTLLIRNLFIFDPHEAVQDVLEVNFGFQVTSVAGMQVNNNEEKKDGE